MINTKASSLAADKGSVTLVITTPGGNIMGVLVCYDDFTYDVVNDYHLDFLVSTGSIVGYDKSEEWVKKESLPQLPNEVGR